MRPDHIKQIYGPAVAAVYDERFIQHPWARPGVEYERQTISTILALLDNPQWLDVGCGTGYHLSKHPGVARAGLDLAPDMLARAREANPDALFIREGDFREPHPDLDGRFDLLTCTWVAYSYVDTLDEIGTLVTNLAKWATPRGTCFLPVIDVEDLRGVRVPYSNEDVNFGGTITVSAVYWTWLDPSGRLDGPLLAPHADHLMALFREHFPDVRLLHYPRQPHLPEPRKAILATREHRLARQVTTAILASPKT